MPSWDKIAARASRRTMNVFGAPCTYLRKSIDDRVATRVVVEKDVEVMGQFAEVVELKTFGSLLVAEVGKAGRGDVLVFGDMAYHVRKPLSNDGSMIQVELLPDPELHIQLQCLEPMGHVNQFVHIEWADLWETISTHKSVQ